MSAPGTDGGGRADGEAPPPVPGPSPRVRLEAALARTTVLVVAAEEDLRRYVRECLRERPALRLLEAESVPAAVALAAHRAVLLFDDVPRDAPAWARLRLLARPFTARELAAEIDRLLG